MKKANQTDKSTTTPVTSLKQASHLIQSAHSPLLICHVAPDGDAIGSVVLFPKIEIYSGEASRAYEVNLSDMAGKKTEFILWVEAKNGPVEGCVKWTEPKIVQE